MVKTIQKLVVLVLMYHHNVTILLTTLCPLCLYQREVRKTRGLARTEFGLACWWQIVSSVEVEAAKRAPYRRSMLGADTLLSKVYTSC